ncbi:MULTISPECIES: four helix bundle protein [Nostocales]|uniref:four helix bundle protein n=1 Tax=Nostocales TaxID=1161 RepID=UPI0009D6A17C|nr:MULTISPECIES: four helix bundle protein [unclassified Anabaena]MCX5984598.1 four helix bundle protein [Nostocales cyanobacterium LacPavin_0920_SED1_MAG_38_18]
MKKSKITQNSLPVPCSLAPTTIFNAHLLIRFLNILQGSVNELETHLILSKRVGLCSEKDIEMILNLLKEESRMIISLIKKLEN